MSPFSSVGVRLAVALLIVVGGALGIVYLIVVPFYSRALVNGELHELRGTLTLVASAPRNVAGETFPSQSWLEDEAEPLTLPLGARVAIFAPPPLLEPIADSNGDTSQDIADDPLVRAAADQNGIVSREVTRQGVAYAEAALSLGLGQPIFFVATPLHSELDSVAVVQRRVIAASVLATLFAIVLGYALAHTFARRIRRLEAAAERIAEGHFDETVSDAAPDELGQLARAFEQMRLRLASLERARAEFIANASHELRTPLFSLSGFLELLTEDEEVSSATREEFLTTMRGQVSRLTRLATVLLDLSRMDAGQLVVSRETVDMNLVCETLAADFAPRVATSGHTLRYQPTQAEVIAVADEARTLQIGAILVDNAIVHTPAGTKIELAAGLRDGLAILTVADDGPGIPHDARTAVFERFYRLGGGVASGSGLGLAIAHELAVLMDGALELDSAPGCNRFTLSVPLSPPEPSANGDHSAQTHGGTGVRMI